MINLEIQNIYRIIEEFLQKEDYESINKFIDNFLLTNLNLTLYVSLLIAINRRKTKINKHRDLYNKARKLAILKGKERNVLEEAIEYEVDLLLLAFK